MFLLLLRRALHFGIVARVREVSRLHRRLRARGRGCCVLGTPAVDSRRFSQLVHRLRSLRTGRPRRCSRGSPDIHINDSLGGRFHRIRRECPVLSLNGACSRARMQRFCRHIQGTLGRSFRVYYRLGFSNASVSLACRSKQLIRTIAHNSNMQNSSIASGIGAVHSVPLHLSNRNCPHQFRVQNRVLVP